jgi:hypothetical protein
MPLRFHIDFIIDIDLRFLAIPLPLPPAFHAILAAISPPLITPMATPASFSPLKAATLTPPLLIIAADYC